MIWHRPSVATLFCRRLAEMASLPCHQSHVWIHYTGDITWLISFLSTILAFLKTMSEKHRSSSPSATQVKNRLKAISIGEKRAVISWLEKGEWNVDICHNVRLAHSSTPHFRLKLTELKRVLSQELNCLCRNEPYQMLWMWVSYVYIAVQYTNVYILHIQYICNLRAHISTSGVVIHYTGWGCQIPNLQDTHRFK